MRTLIAAAAVFSLMPAAALAQTDKPQSQDVGKSDRMVCKSIKMTGSRLAKKRVCQTASEWEDVRRQEQTLIERIQGSRPGPGEPITLAPGG